MAGLGHATIRETASIVLTIIFVAILFVIGGYVVNTLIKQMPLTGVWNSTYTSWTGILNTVIPIATVAVIIAILIPLVLYLISAFGLGFGGGRGGE